MKAEKWILVKHFEGEPQDSDMELQDEILPDLKDGDVLFEAVCFSVDPYFRPFSASLALGSVMIGEQVARVQESRHRDYKQGDLYQSMFGWRTHTIVNMNRIDLPDMESLPRITRLPDMGGLPPSLALGSLGMPGSTAYVGLLDTCKLKEGDVVLVSGAAGAVGSVVGQIAKIKGCTVIGSAGSDEKLEWLKELGFDHVFNYKTCNISDAIQKSAPDGVDVYYDNVGGDYTSIVIRDHMRMHGRIGIIGTMSQYNDTEAAQGPLPFGSILFKRLHIEGLIISDASEERRQQGKEEIKEWILQGKLKYREHVTSGFANMRSAFYGLFRGDNIGKAIVNV